MRRGTRTGYGVVVAFAPRRHQVRVLPSPQLSLLEDSDGLTKVFAQAAQSDLARGDDAGAAVSGVNGLMRRLGDVPSRLAPPVKRGWRFSRAMLLLILAGLAFGGLIILWITLRVLRAANIFDHSYRLARAGSAGGIALWGPALRRTYGYERISPALEAKYAQEGNFDRKSLLNIAAQVIAQFLESANSFQNVGRR